MPIQRPTPISEQVNGILRGRIRDETYPAGGRLPSESDLSHEFGVSRATVRTVLAKLSAEGLILRKQGDGTYVNLRISEVNTHLGGLWDFFQLIEGSGYAPSIKLISVEQRGAFFEEAVELGILKGAPVLALKRLFYADENAAILALNVIPRTLIEASIEEIDGELHIRQFMNIYCRRRIAYTISDVQAERPNDEVLACLDRVDDDPLLSIQMTFYDRDNHPILYGQSYYDDSRLRLRLVQAWG